MLLGIVTVLSVLSALAITLPTCALEGLGAIWVLPVSFLGTFLGLALIVFLVVWISCALVKMEELPEKESKYYRFLAQSIAQAAMPILLTKVHTKGLKQTPKDGRFLLVCNHLNNLDPVVLLRSFPKSRLAFISKQENDTMFIVGPIMRKILCQPINRENDRQALKTIIRCIQIIKEDKASIAVFPEGYIHGDGLLHPLRSGVFKIALKTNVPIVVCTLQNTPEVMGNAAHLRTSDVHLHLIKVIDPAQYEGCTATQVGDMVYNLMATDLGPEKVWKPEENREETE